MVKFSITHKLKTVGEINSVRDQILDHIPENVLFSQSKSEVCGFVLNQFDFPEEKINMNNTKSLEEGCKTVMAFI